MPKKKSKIIQVPMPEELVESLDRLSYERGESRSFVIREAAARYVADADEAEAVRQYIQSYIDEPETDEERAIGETGAILAAAAWDADDDWSEEYAQFLKADDASR